MYADGPIADGPTAVFEPGVFEPGVFEDGQLPAMVLKAVVLDLGRKTHDGQIVQAVAYPWFDIMKMIERDPSIAYQIDWRKWEEIIAGAWQRTGFFDK